MARNARVQIYRLGWTEVPQNQTELAFFALSFLLVMPFLNLRMLRLLAGNIGLCTSVFLKKIIINQFQLNILEIVSHLLDFSRRLPQRYLKSGEFGHHQKGKLLSQLHPNLK